MSERGRVSFVGIGSGDPRKLTHAAGEVLSSADVIIAPEALPAVLYSAFNPEAEIVDSRKADLRAMLMEGRRVARLFWGTPLETGLGPTEVEVVRATGAAWEVVEGASLFGIAASSAGVRTTPGSAIVSGYDQRPTASWKLPPSGSTGLRMIAVREEMADALKGLADQGQGDASAIVVAAAGLPNQVVVTGRVENISLPSVGGPLVAFVGAVFSLDPDFQWFAGRPLFGRRIVVTRPRHQADDLANALRGRGADVLILPTIRISDPPDRQPLLQAAAAVGDYDWVVFTSANGVDRFWAALEEGGLDSRALGGVKICAIGPATGAEVRRRGAGVDLMPDEYVAESVIEAMRGAVELEGTRILLPRADIARDVLPTTLAELGAAVNEVAAYQTVADEEGVAGLREVVERGGVDLVTFTSSSTVRNFAELVSREIGEMRVASIGPITSATAREYGWPVEVEAEEHTADGLIKAIERHYVSG